MGGFSPEQVRKFRILCAVIPAFVFLVTAFRLWVKGRARWWWDDAFAMIGVVTMATQQGLMWGSLSLLANHTVPMGLFYAVIICTFLQVFCARLAILVTVIRISPNSRTRTVSQCVGVLFIFLFFLLVGQLFWVCETHLEYIPVLNMTVCGFTKEVPMVQFAVAMVADSLLIVIPLHSLRLLSTKSTLRRRLMLIFAASICTTIASLVQSILNLLELPFAVLVAAMMEAWISLLVCNVGVVVTRVSRIRHPSSSVESPSNCGAPPTELQNSDLRFAPPPEFGAQDSDLDGEESQLSFVTALAQSMPSSTNDDKNGVQILSGARTKASVVPSGELPLPSEPQRFENS